MSLRCIGSQSLQTAPSALMVGASTASLSLWIRANSNSVAANPGGSRLFGDAGGKLSVSISGANQLRVAWSANDGTTDHASGWGQPILAGIGHHLAVTWQDGLQQYFLDGILVRSDDQHGSLGALGDRSSYPFQIGSDSAGVDVTLDEATLWVGYALTLRDAQSLRDRSGAPSTISPGSIALEWSLAGPDGQAAAVGDPGLVDQSPTGLNLSTIRGTAASYQAGVLSYSAPQQGCRATVAPSGEGILFTFADPSGVPSRLLTINPDDEVQSLALLGNPAGGAFTLGFGGRSTAPIAAIPNAPPVYFEYVVTLDAPGRHDLAVNLIYNSNLSDAVLYEVFDGSPPAGTPPLGSATLNQSTGLDNGNPGTFCDGTLLIGGLQANWMPIGTYAFTGTTARVRLSCGAPASAGAGQTMYIDGLRVATTGGPTVRVVGPAVPPAIAAGPSYNPNNSSTYDVAGLGNHVELYGVGRGPYYTVDPSAVQSALAALPGIGPGNVTVSGFGATFSPLTIQFTGALTNQALPMITSGDPAVSIARVSAGGSLPRLVINGGAPTSLLDFYWFRNGQSTYAYYPFIQSHPAATYQAMGTYLNAVSGGGWSPSTLASYGEFAQAASGAGPYAYWREEGLPAATYRLSVTWPVDPGNSAQATYTVTDDAGNVLGSSAVDQTRSPGGDVDQGVVWHVLGSFTTTNQVDALQVTLSNGSTGRIQADAARFERTSADQSIAISAGDVLSYSSGSWATTAAGPVPPVVGAPISNLLGTTIYPPLPATPKTMPVGWNINQTYGYAALSMYANIAHRYEVPLGVASDADGYPLILNGPSNGILLAFDPATHQADGLHWISLPDGNYWLLWDGSCVVTMSGTEDPSHRSLTGTTDNTRLVAVAGGVISVQIQGTTPVGDGTWNCDLKNLRIYPQSEVPDPINPPKFLPSFLAKLRGVQSLRFLDPIGAIEANCTDFTDYDRPQSILSKFRQARYLQVPIASVRNYDGPTYFDPGSAVIYEFTTAVAHGFSEGQVVIIVGSPAASLSNGSIASLSFDSPIHVISDTSFLMAGSPGGGVSMVGTITQADFPGMAVQMFAGNGMPIRDMIELCNDVGADFYLNTNLACTDDCLSRLGELFATALNPGLKLRVECSNETWNVPGLTWLYFVANTFGRGLGATGEYIPLYCVTSAHHWAVIGAAMAAAGRGGDMIRVLGSAHADPGITASLVRYCATHAIGFDALTLAPYLNNQPAYSTGPANDGANDPMANLMTTDQVLDIFECNYGLTDYAGDIMAHRRVLDAAGFTSTKIVTYEGGPDEMLPLAGNAMNLGRRSHAVHRHPRFFHLLLQVFQTFQDAGLALFQFYLLSGGDGSPGGGFEMWSAYTGTGQLPGTGDPALDAANIASPDDQSTLKSETGGALSYWASLVRSNSRRSIPGRNGLLRSTGYPRGCFRPTR